MTVEAINLVMSEINFFRKDGCVNTQLQRSSETLNFLHSRVEGFRNFSEAVYCYLNSLSSPPRCLCGKYTQFKSFIKGHSDFCSKACANRYNASAQSKTKQAHDGEQLNDIQIKRINTNQKRYGVDYTSRLDTIKEKIIATNQKRYGVDYASQTKIKKEQTVLTCKCTSPFHTNPAQFHINADVLEKLSNPKWLFEQYQTKSIPTIAWELGVDKTVIQDRFKKFNIITTNHTKDSKPETVIQTILEDNNIEFIKKNKTILNGLELDFYIPSINLAIEYNGLYWHSFDAIPTPKQKNKHHKKFELCQSQGIYLLQLTEINLDKLTTFLTAKIQPLPKIYARQCVIKNISSDTFKAILDQYHLQGYRACKIKYGIFFNNELVGAVGFNNNSKYGWELSRLVFTMYRVVGGSSKLIKHFCREHNPTQIVSYSANSYSDGNVYKALGFKEVSSQKYDLWYVKNDKLINRQKLQKHKLINILDKYDCDLTEQQNLLNNGYRIYYGPGTKTWLLQGEN
jgi:hypothetical protein